MLGSLWLATVLLTPSFAQTPEKQQVLVLITTQYGLQVPDAFVRGVVAGLKEKGIGANNIYVEYLDLTRNNTPGYKRNLATLLHQKLSSKPIGLIITHGVLATRFLEDEGLSLFPKVPLIINHAEDQIEWRGPERNVIMQASVMDLAGTLRSALSLLPNTQLAVVLLGRDVERIQRKIQSSLRPFVSKLTLQYTQDLSYEEMLQRVSSLPPNSIILNPSYFGDNLGRNFVPADVSAKLRHWEIRFVRLPASKRRLLRASVTDITEREAARAAISKLNSELEARVIHRTAELQHALEQLRLYQKELVQSEKLAALGFMVAGVAHELNTPIGNSLLATTTLSHNLLHLENSMAQGMTRSAMQRFLADSTEILQMTEANLLKASDLIASFKQVAVNRSTADRRKLFLMDICNESMQAIALQLSVQSTTIDVSVPESISLDSYAEPLTQVLTCLIKNALLHGFDGHPNGRLHISASVQSEWVRIDVADNGCGIPADLQSRIFSPFFTTRMGRGGTGLGLHIAYNLIRSVLGGRIFFVSQEGRGTTFTIELPCISPDSSKLGAQEAAFVTGTTSTESS